MFKKIFNTKNTKKIYIIIAIVLLFLAVYFIVNLTRHSFKENLENNENNDSSSLIFFGTNSKNSTGTPLSGSTLVTPPPLICNNCPDKTFWTFPTTNRNPVKIDSNDVSANNINGCRDYCDKNQPCEGWLINPRDQGCHIYPTVGSSGELTRSCKLESGREWFGEINSIVKDRLKIIDAEPCMNDTASSCSGTLFKNDINSNMTVVPQSKTYTHSNAAACEAECTIDRLCAGISFDTKSKDKMKKCTLYSAAPANAADGIKANTICSRNSPKCTVDGYNVNNISQDLLQKESSFTHSNEGACAVECTNRDNCEGYFWDSTSKEKMKPCYIFSKADSSAITGFPISSVCSKTS